MNVTRTGDWDETVLSLMWWDSAGTAVDLAALPRASFYPAHGVAASPFVDAHVTCVYPVYCSWQNHPFTGHNHLFVW